MQHISSKLLKSTAAYSVIDVNTDTMLHTYVLKIVYIRHFKTKVERHRVIRCCHDGHILNQVRVCFLALLKRFVPSSILNIMVVWCSLLNILLLLLS